MWVGATVVGASRSARTAASSALTYVSSFPTEREPPAARRDAPARDTGLAVLLGPVSSIDTVGGYTVYKGFVFLTTIGAIWALLAATRLLRGEEDAGRWQLVLAGGTRPRAGTAATLVALGGAVGVVFAGTTAAHAARRPQPRRRRSASARRVLYGLSIAIAPAVFVARRRGHVAARPHPPRRDRARHGRASASTFVLRMIADSGPGTRWLLWATPFGWTELMRPFTENDPWPLRRRARDRRCSCWRRGRRSLRRAATSATACSRRATSRRLRPFGLGSPFGLACPARAAGPRRVVRRALRPPGLLFGIIAKVDDRLGARSRSATPSTSSACRARFVNQYLGVAFLLVATVVALLPAGQIGAASDEETSGRLVHVLVATDPPRRRWFAGRLALGGRGRRRAGVARRARRVARRDEPGRRPRASASMLGAGLNVVPTALVALGIGAVVLAVAPRAAATAVYAVVVWSLVVDLSASMVDGPRWLEHLSLFHYMALAPAQDIDPTTVAITLAVGSAAVRARHCPLRPPGRAARMSACHNRRARD